MADGLSRHLNGDVITPIPPPLPLPGGEGHAEDTCASIIKHECGDLPCYKEFASLMLFLDSYPPVPLSTWKGGKRIASASAPVRAQPARKARKRKEQENSRRSFPALFVSAASGCRGCARSGAIRQSQVKRRTTLQRFDAQAFPRAFSVGRRAYHARKPD